MRVLICLLFLCLLYLFTNHTAHAVCDPLTVPNNKFGMHILFQSEIHDAAPFINSNGGEWGYVTIPIQALDKDLEKWQLFMDEARTRKVIPILRIATENFYFDTKVWKKPRSEDVIDFANFLNALDWPVKNRYVVIFNEVNRGDEWGGEVNPKEYAELLSFAVSVFKSVNQDFYIISAGLDNAAPNQPAKYMDQFTYMQQMNEAVPGIFNQVDAVSSHAYPNPGFLEPPTSVTQKSISSFTYEREFLKSISQKKLPIFITETGWDAEKLGHEKTGEYYKQAFESVWSDPDIVAITPFIYKAGDGPFKKFSFLNPDGSKTKQYEIIGNMTKVKGQPPISLTVLGTTNKSSTIPRVKRFQVKKDDSAFSVSQIFQSTFAWIMKLD